VGIRRRRRCAFLEVGQRTESLGSVRHEDYDAGGRSVVGYVVLDDADYASSI